jgi:thioredoxin-related protein
MKPILLLVLSIITLCPAAMADKKKKAVANVDYVDSTQIKWLDWDEVQVQMNKKPKKVWVDAYTDWCGWCKRMDNTTFKNKEVIKYMNKNFYAVKFNVEKQDSIRFMGKMYYIAPENSANTLAIELMRGSMSYPTFIYMEENFQNHFPIPGYLKVEQIEGILKFLGEENHKKNIKYEEYLQTFKPEWVTAEAQN